MNDSGGISGARVFGVGEVLWDLLPEGKQLGGAPANFAYHARALGADGRIISRVGDDELGREIVARLDALGVPTAGISLDPVHATGTVSVQIDAGGQPHYEIHRNVAWDHLELTAEASRAVAEAAVICFGTLGQRSGRARDTIQHLVTGTAPDAFRIFDVNLRRDDYTRDLIEKSLRIANVVKLNDQELPVIAGLVGIEGTPESQLESLLDRYHLRAIACTRGSEGSWIFDGSEWSRRPGIPTKVRDTIGAGDAFTAAFALGLLAGWPVDQIAAAANEIAAFVCSCPGATPEIPDRLKKPFLEAGRPTRNRTQSL